MSICWLFDRSVVGWLVGVGWTPFISYTSMLLWEHLFIHNGFKLKDTQDSGKGSLAYETFFSSVRHIISISE